ncbi:MAG: divergent polysaccharide deacetylase family protein [Endomicrobiales bacterium]|nr:divergent polysaccharide deacetylase family protein [Endomicrobiales bacterium]
MLLNSKGIVKIAYLAVLFLLGVLIWLLWQSAKRDYTAVCVDFDGMVNAVLVQNGVRDSDILAQVRKERKALGDVWVEYEKKIKISGKADPEKIMSGIKKSARGLEIGIETKKEKSGSFLVEAYLGRKCLMRLSLVAKTGKSGKKAAIVIDDVGYAKNLEPFIDIGIPITFAILPSERYSKYSAQFLSKKSMPYILHMPLEPEGYPEVDPGKAAILVSMGRKEIKEKFYSALESVTGAVGVSNHMGSRFSADAEKMRIFLELVKQKGLFYFDSYTSQKTKAEKVAREIDMPFAENAVFLDVKDDPEYYSGQMEIFLRKAKKTGRAIAIGHIHKKELPNVIKSKLEKFRENGIEFVYLDEIVRDESK